MESMDAHRRVLKSDRWREWEGTTTDQRAGVPAPPIEKPCPPDAQLIDLVAPADLTVGTLPLIEAIRRRRSRRRFTAEPLTLEELSFLLWATQGVHELLQGGARARRTVPSAGGRHPFETYLAVHNVAGLEPGLYRYLALEHQLCLLRTDPALPQKVIDGCRGQAFAGQCAATFIWTAVPYRAEWRYGTIAHKTIAVDAGHLCQNLYLAAESIGAGTCAIGLCDQEAMDSLLGVDGRDEFTIYIAAVGKVQAP